ncbi:MAG: pyrroline-5-carboxylate reductase [Planctomycetes bacterium]|nr:pyrroline-5-carboxylate reductase [Planctomycetota bacterium]
MINNHVKLAIIGAGNIGLSIAKGLVASKHLSAGQIILTRRKTGPLDSFAQKGYVVMSDNQEAVKRSGIIIIAVRPQEINGILRQIAPKLAAHKHLLISVVSGVAISQIAGQINKKVAVVRAMPNIAAAIRESMTCICGDDQSAVKRAAEVFGLVGETVIIDEGQMIPATALCACGIAFFLRAIRAASQGGIEIGFHPEESIRMSAQTAKGAAALLLNSEYHPEMEIDRVTTPRGCTIAGLNQMEHSGFSSAMIKGILTSSEKAEDLYNNSDGARKRP